MAQRFLETLRTGSEAIRAAAESTKKLGKYVPITMFNEKDGTRYFQFVDPMTSWPTLLMHQFIIVGKRKDGKDQYERFVSRRDPNIEGKDGYDEIIDRFGEYPKERTAALAIELLPNLESGSGGRKVIKGFDITEREFDNRDGDTITVPNFTLILESPRTLFGDLEAVFSEITAPPVEETIVGIKVTGSGTDKEFHVMDTNQAALDLTEEIEKFSDYFDLSDYLEELASEERMREIISPLPDGWKITNYPTKKDEKKDDKKAKVTRKPVDDTEPERSPRDFKQLRAKVGDKDSPATEPDDGDDIPY